MEFVRLEEAGGETCKKFAFNGGLVSFSNKENPFI